MDQLYERALTLMREAEKQPRGVTRQDLYLKARGLFEEAYQQVESLNLFSDNEALEDIPTIDLKYLLIDAYLANIAVSLECTINRLDNFIRAKFSIERFFQQIFKYQLGNEAIENALKSDKMTYTPESCSSDLECAMRARNEKIEKYRRMQLLDKRLDELDRMVNQRGQEQDEETIREYYTNLIKKWIENTYECLEREVKPAIAFEKSRSIGPLDDPPAASKKSMDTRTITIVKDELQKQVFGIGYPSKPTVTVNEFVDKKIKDGDWVFQAHKEVYANSLQRYAEKPTLVREQEELSDIEHEEKEEREDMEELKRKRNWDEFKDNNPRGSGNKYNMG